MTAAASLLGASLLALSPAPRESGVRAFALAVPAGERVQDALTVDLDGDGQLDVVVAAERGAFARSLHVFLARPGGTFGGRPDQTLALTPDVVAWAAGDVAAEPGAELVLFNARGAFAWRMQGAPEQRFTRLAQADFLWQLPDPAEAFAYPRGLVDLDLDRLPDLALPEPGGFRLVLQRRSPEGVRFDLASVLRVPAEDADSGLYIAASEGRTGLRGERSESQLRIGLQVESDRERVPEILLTSVESCPSPHFLDWNADGRLDLVAQGTQRLFVWLQAADGRFASAPDVSLPLPVAADRSRRLDASYSSHVLDLDRDGRADVVVFAGDKRAESVRTQALVFTQKPPQKPEAALFGPKGVPQQLLVLAGFVGSVTFDDVDGDRNPDLVVRGVRPDLIDQLRSATNESIDVDFFVYRNEGGRFGERPLLSWQVTVPIKNFDLTLRFAGDVDGDRRSDLCVRDTPERLRLLRLVPRRGGGLEVEQRKALFELAVHAEARVRFGTPQRSGASDVIVLEPDLVRIVRSVR